MASLQQINSRFYIRFRYGRRPFRSSLKTRDRTEAEMARKQVELTLHRINAGFGSPRRPPYNLGGVTTGQRSADHQ